MITKYRDYVRHLTDTYSLSDEDLDDFVINWNCTYDISQMCLNLVDEEEEAEKKFFMSKAARITFTRNGDKEGD